MNHQYDSICLYLDASDEHPLYIYIYVIPAGALGGPNHSLIEQLPFAVRFSTCSPAQMGPNIAYDWERGSYAQGNVDVSTSMSDKYKVTGWVGQLGSYL